MNTVSVVITTYNHAPYLEQAIESVLAQEAEFPFEIIIGEDDSGDGTREIARRYESKHPGKIRVNYRLRSEATQGPGEVPGNRNYASAQMLATGKYIALLDGDDYWTDTTKLRRQVEILESRPGVTLCCHNVSIQSDDPNEPSRLAAAWTADHEAPLEHILWGNWIYTGSVMFRRNVIASYPDWFYCMPAGDWATFVILLHNAPGTIYCLNRVMSVYRVHEKGAWGSKSRAEVLESTIRSARILNAGLEGKYNREITQTICHSLKERSLIREGEGRYREALADLYAVLRESRKPQYLDWKRFLRLHGNCLRSLLGEGAK